MSAYRELRSFQSIDTDLSLATIDTWMRAHGIAELLSDWLPYFRAMEDERRSWYVEQLRERAKVRSEG